jgi:hypothetical protein
MTDNTNTPTQHQVLMDSIAKYLLGMIEGIVERKVAEIMQSHATMALIDEKTEGRIREIALELIEEHESDQPHESRDDNADLVATHIAHHDFSHDIKETVEAILSDIDYVTEDRVVDIVTDEIDFEEKVKEVLRNL